MPCMNEKTEIGERTEEMERRKAEHTLTQKKYNALTESSVQDKLDKKSLQEAALETNAEEDHIEQQLPRRRLREKNRIEKVASFSSEGVYAKPSDFIKEMLAVLPKGGEAKSVQDTLHGQACRGLRCSLGR